MLPNDGRFEIFTIEFADKERKEWNEINFDSAWVSPEYYVSKKDVWYEFSASGKCWQETGVNGTFNVEIALKLYNLLNKESIKKEKYLFRVVKTTIWQESEVLWSN
jgi:hypothetical protein